MLGEEGFTLLDGLEETATPAELKVLEQAQVLRRVWQRHSVRVDPTQPPTGTTIRLKTKAELAADTDRSESPYEREARYRSKQDHSWKGYLVHWSETCGEDAPHLITHSKTTPSPVHEGNCTESIHHALAEKDLQPDEHLVGTAYISVEQLVESQAQHNVTLVGPPRLFGRFCRRQ